MTLYVLDVTVTIGVSEALYNTNRLNTLAPKYDQASHLAVNGSHYVPKFMTVDRLILEITIANS